MTGTQLTQIPAQIIGFGDFRVAWPNGEVLTRRTGYRRSEEHTSELQPLMRISNAVFCLHNKRIHRAVNIHIAITNVITLSQSKLITHPNHTPITKLLQPI